MTGSFESGYLNPGVYYIVVETHGGSSTGTVTFYLGSSSQLNTNLAIGFFIGMLGVFFVMLIYGVKTGKITKITVLNSKGQPVN